MSDHNPYEAPSFGETGNAAIVASSDQEIRNVRADLNDILNYSFRVWKENLGVLVGATAIVLGIAIGIGILSALVEAILKGGFQNAPTLTSTLFSSITSLVSNAIQLFLGIGFLKMILALLRGQQGSMEMLFSGGERFLPTLGFSILFGLAVTLGLLLLIVPGIILLVFYWPAYYLVIDRKTPVMQSFSLARVITKGNELTTIMLGLLCMGIVILGFLAICIGLLFAQPLALTLAACAYLVMSGQLDPRAAMSPTRY